MVKLIRQGVYFMDGKLVKEAHAFMTSDKKERAVRGRISHAILKAHGGAGEKLLFRFDALTSSQESYIGLIRMANACGMKSFSLPYVMMPAGADQSAVAFGLSAAKRYGGEFVPPALASSAFYLSETAAKTGNAVLYSDGAPAVGPLGAMAVRGSFHELLRQLLGKKTELLRPAVVAVCLKGKLRRGVGPTDVALSLLQASKNGYLSGKILEFIGPALQNLPMEMRLGIDAAVRRTGCLATVWETDGRTREYFAAHGREGDFKEVRPARPAFYDGGAVVDLSRIEPMIALGRNVFALEAFQRDADALLQRVAAEGSPIAKIFTLKEDGIYVSSAKIVETCGGYGDLAEAAEILRMQNAEKEAFSLICEAATPSSAEYLAENGLTELLRFGAAFSAGRGLSIPSGGLSNEGEVCMDARSIAATAANGGRLTSALGLSYPKRPKKYSYHGEAYQRAVYHGVGAPQPETELAFCDEISEYVPPAPLGKHLLLKAVDGDFDVGAAETFDGSDGASKETRTGYLLLSVDHVGLLRNAERLRDSGVLAVAAKEYPADVRTALIAHGILPFLSKKSLKAGEVVSLDNFMTLIRGGKETFSAKVRAAKGEKEYILELGSLSPDERKIVLKGCLANFYREDTK